MKCAVGTKKVLLANMKCAVGTKNIEICLLLNFGTEPEFKRKIYTNK